MPTCSSRYYTTCHLTCLTCYLPHDLHHLPHGLHHLPPVLPHLSPDLQDLVQLVNADQPLWLQGIVEMTRTFGLELLETLLAGYSHVFYR